ncbi:MAG: protein transport protein S31 [Chaenotheca gracillima]|nr:MAG: protein transport protein S31 [Chaenotheca gracillima]
MSSSEADSPLFSQVGPFQVGITTARGLLVQMKHGTYEHDGTCTAETSIGVQDRESFGVRVIFDEVLLQTTPFEGSIKVDGDQVLDFCHIVEIPTLSPVLDIPWAVLQSASGALVTRELVFSALESDVWERQWRRKLREPEFRNNIGVIEVRFSKSRPGSQEAHLSSYGPQNEGKKVHEKDRPGNQHWTHYTRLGRQEAVALDALRIFSTEKEREESLETIFRIHYISEGIFARNFSKTKRTGPDEPRESNMTQSNQVENFIDDELRAILETEDFGVH